MTGTETTGRDSVLAAVLSDEGFFPAEPRSIEDTGLAISMIESLIAKQLSTIGTASGRGLADALCLPFGVLDPLYQGLRTRQILVHTGSAPLNDYYYTLTEQGAIGPQRFASHPRIPARRPCPCPSIYCRSRRNRSGPKRQTLASGKGVCRHLDQSRAVRQPGSGRELGAGLFLYGSPGNGKSTLARRITVCFGQHIWMPQTLIEDGQIIKLFDGVYHEVVENKQSTLMKAASHDRRWVEVAGRRLSSAAN